MPSESTNLISFTESRRAVGLSGLFASDSDSFETYMDEKYHWDPEKPVNARHAGLMDAVKAPPKPETTSESPSDVEYLSALHRNGQTFLEDKIQACRETFDQLKDRVGNLLDVGSGPLWDGELANTSGLRDAIADRDLKQRACDDYAKEKEHLIGNRILHPTPRSPVIFVCFVIFVAVFEFVWVWYFLSGELGLSAAVNVSLAAATVVIMIAGLSAWSLAITEKDVEDQRKRLMGHLGIVLCVLVFLFGLGLLSAWRADSTNDGFGYILDGYRSLVEIDVFVTALVNLGGVILLTHELGRFLWPYPLYYYGHRARELADSKRVVTDKKVELNDKLAQLKKEVNRHEAEIQNLINETYQFGQNAGPRLRGCVREVNRKIEESLNAYVERNSELRTRDVYPEPKWYADNTNSLNVCTDATEAAIQMTVAHIRSELRMTVDGQGEAWKAEMERLLQKKVAEARTQINQAQSAIDEFASV